LKKQHPEWLFQGTRRRRKRRFGAVTMKIQHPVAEFHGAGVGPFTGDRKDYNYGRCHEEKKEKCRKSTN
jgi:hypothetical protein